MTEAVEEFVNLGDDLRRINKLIDKVKTEVWEGIDNLRELEKERKRIIDIYMLEEK